MHYRRTFLKTSLGIAVTALSLPSIAAKRPSHLASSDMPLRAGAGRADANLSGLYPIAEFVGEHDPLSTRVLLLEGGGQRQALVVVDLTSITPEVITRMKAILSEMANVPSERAIVIASHTFSTPHIFIGPKTEAANGAPGASNRADATADATLDAFETALRSATQQAVATLQPARIGASSGYCRIGVNRNVVTPHGWWLGADDAGFSDPSVGVIRINGQYGKPLAILMNCSVQPAVMDASERAAGGRLVSADLAGATARHVEQHYGGDAVALYLVGSAGDQVPYLQASRHVTHADGSVSRVDMHESGFTLLDLFGQRLGDEVIRVTDSIASARESTLGAKRDAVSVTALAFSPRNAPQGPVKSFNYRLAGHTTMPFTVFRWGEIALVGVQPEFSAIVGARIRAASPFAHTLIMTMADGAAKYLPDAQSYDRFTYEARSSPFAKGTDDLVVAAIVEQLKLIRA